MRGVRLAAECGTGRRRCQGGCRAHRVVTPTVLACMGMRAWSSSEHERCPDGPGSIGGTDLMERCLAWRGDQSRPSSRRASESTGVATPSHGHAPRSPPHGHTDSALRRPHVSGRCPVLPRWTTRAIARPVARHRPVLAPTRRATRRYRQHRNQLLDAFPTTVRWSSSSASPAAAYAIICRVLGVPEDQTRRSRNAWRPSVSQSPGNDSGPTWKRATQPQPKCSSCSTGSFSSADPTPRMTCCRCSPPAPTPMTSSRTCWPTASSSCWPGTPPPPPCSPRGCTCCRRTQPSSPPPSRAESRGQPWSRSCCATSHQQR